MLKRRGDAEPLGKAPGQNPQTAEHMPENIFRFGRVFRLLEKSFHAGHEPPFFCLLYPVPHKDDPAAFPVQWCKMENSLAPAGYQGIRFP